MISGLFYRHPHETVRHLLAAELHVDVVCARLFQQVENVEEAILLDDLGVDEPGKVISLATAWIDSQPLLTFRSAI